MKQVGINYIPIKEHEQVELIWWVQWTHVNPVKFEMDLPNLPYT